ncbi:truncated membrane protein ORF40 [Cyprinid herpesvirus 3]|uniref:ORF40L n=1 Tax=Cyprinid herpesvirus 3 TaxID=180230 RepID=H8PF56_CYHV3|nr:unnamed protein product [Cyprinid herpesvirus 3]AFD97201.1 truncated membrane protein ORF40 [Cyprinid herpesvirus 3]AIC32395.1 ORF40L [Cyprinid herpesvirus 3]AOO32447.1 truncated membrane protein ORF40 [Cyprinid herpesvirus 3]
MFLYIAPLYPVPHHLQLLLLCLSAHSILTSTIGIQENQAGTLTCPCSSGQTAFWLLGGHGFGIVHYGNTSIKLVNPRVNETLQLQHTVKSCSLTIRSALARDAGLYICVLNNGTFANYTVTVEQTTTTEPPTTTTEEPATNVITRTEPTTPHHSASRPSPPRSLHADVGDHRAGSRLGTLLDVC